MNDLPPEVRRAGRLVFLVALALYLATTGGSMATDVMSYEVTKGIVEHGTVAMSRDVFHMEAHRGVDGRYYAPYGIGHALYSIPFYAAARLAERWTGLAVGKPEAFRKAGFVIGSAVAAALTVWLAFLFAWRLSTSVGGALEAALVLGFGTMLWPYAKFGFSAPLATLCVLLGTYGLWAGARFDRPVMFVLGGAGLGGALLVKHELALVCLPAALWLAAESRDRHLMWKRWLLSGMPVAAAILVTLYYNDVRFGNPLDSGYLRDETVAFGSIWVGVAGLLLSPGRSLFLYSPVTLAGLVALIALGRRDRPTMVLFAGECLVLLIFYGSLAHWDAERSYGPRYLLPIVPFLVLPLAGSFARHRDVDRRTRHGRPLAALVALSVLVQLPGILVDFSKVGFTPAVGERTWEERRWGWEASGLSLNTRAALAAIPRNVKYFATGERPPVRAPRPGAEDFADQFGFSLDFWWVYLFYLGAISAPLALALGAVCLSAAAFLAWRLRPWLVTPARGVSVPA